MRCYVEMLGEVPVAACWAADAALAMGALGTAYVRRVR